MVGKVKDGAAIGATAAADAVAVIGTAPGVGETVSDEVRATDGARIVAEGTSAAATAAAEAAAAGGSGAGIGGQRVVEAVGGIATRDVPLVGADHAGDRRGTFDRPSRDSRGEFGTYLDDIAAGRRTGAYDAVGVAVASTRPGRNVILPLAQPKLDPSLVPGVKVATAVAQVRRGGWTYAPGEEVPIDFKAHAQLTEAGVILATPWHDLPDHTG